MKGFQPKRTNIAKIVYCWKALPSTIEHSERLVPVRYVIRVMRRHDGSNTKHGVGHGVHYGIDHWVGTWVGHGFVHDVSHVVRRNSKVVVSDPVTRVGG